MTRESILQFLEDLGSSPNEVADTLRKNNIKGIPNTLGCCPIARYLQLISGDKNILVDTMSVAFNTETLENPKIEQTLLPFGAKLFAYYFDRRLKYQDLVQENNESINGPTSRSTR